MSVKLIQTGARWKKKIETREKNRKDIEFMDKSTHTYMQPTCTTLLVNVKKKEGGKKNYVHRSEVAES